MQPRIDSPPANADPAAAAPEVAAVLRPLADERREVAADDTPRSLVRADKTTRRPPLV